MMDAVRNRGCKVSMLFFGRESALRCDSQLDAPSQQLEARLLAAAPNFIRMLRPCSVNKHVQIYCDYIGDETIVLDGLCQWAHYTCRLT